MYIRRYMPSDCPELTELFYNTVHTVNAGDYTEEQLDVWAPVEADMGKWDRSLSDHYTLVAVENGIITGFGDIDKTGYFDRLFVHKDYQRRGIASALCDQLEEAVPSGKITIHASITAKPFFEKRGYKTVKEQQIKKQDILLTNYIMEKTRE